MLTVVARRHVWCLLLVLNVLSYVLIAACLVAPSSRRMPHLRSAARRLARHDRAARRGYVRPLPDGHGFVQVPAPLLPRARAQTRALVLHDRFNKATGYPHHFAGSAIAAARPLLGDGELKDALRTNRRAALARHEWASSFDDSDDNPADFENAPFLPPLGGPPERRPTCA